MTATGQSAGHQIEPQQAIEAVLRALLTIGDFGTSNSNLHEKLLSLGRKLASNQLHLAVLGQMKRGKSSFSMRSWVERVFYSFDSFLLLLPRFLLRPVVLRKMHNYVPQLLDINAGRTRYDYLERLQSSMTQFENDLRAAITMVTESLKAAFRAPRGEAQQQTAIMDVLESVVKDCSQVLL